jgi:hypothetical protein
MKEVIKFLKLFGGDGKKFSRTFDNFMASLKFVSSGFDCEHTEALEKYLRQIDEATRLTNEILLARTYSELSQGEASHVWVDYTHNGKDTPSVRSGEWERIGGPRGKRVIGLEFNLDAPIKAKSSAVSVQNEIIDAALQLGQELVLGERRQDIFATQAEVSAHSGQGNL